MPSTRKTYTSFTTRDDPAFIEYTGKVIKLLSQQLGVDKEESTDSELIAMNDQLKNIVTVVEHLMRFPEKARLAATTITKENFGQAPKRQTASKEEQARLPWPSTYCYWGKVPDYFWWGVLEAIYGVECFGPSMVEKFKKCDTGLLWKLIDTEFGIKNNEGLDSALHDKSVMAAYLKRLSEMRGSRLAHFSPAALAAISGTGKNMQLDWRKKDVGRFSLSEPNEQGFATIAEWSISKVHIEKAHIPRDVFMKVDAEIINNHQDLGAFLSGRLGKQSLHLLFEPELVKSLEARWGKQVRDNLLKEMKAELEKTKKDKQDSMLLISPHMISASKKRRLHAPPELPAVGAPAVVPALADGAPPVAPPVAPPAVAPPVAPSAVAPHVGPLVEPAAVEDPGELGVEELGLDQDIEEVDAPAVDGETEG